MRILSLLSGLVAFALWSSLGVFFGRTHLTTELAVGLGSLIGLAFLWIAQLGKKNSVQFTISPALAGLFIVAAVKGGVWFAALRLVPVATAMLIHNLAPVVAMALSGLFLREKPAVTQIIAIPIGLFGLFLLLQPQLGTYSFQTMLGLCFALSAAVASGVQDNCQRKLAHTHTSTTQSLVFVLGQCAGGMVLLRPEALVSLTWDQMPSLLYFGIAGTALPILLLTFAFKGLRAYEVATLGYIEPLLGAIWGAILLNQPITPVLALGGLLIFLSGMGVVRKE